MKLGDISINYVRAVLDTLEGLGGSPNDLLKKYEIKEEVLSQPDARISMARFMRLGHSAIHAVNRVDIGLEMGKQFRLPVIGLAGILAMTAKDIETACRVIAHYEPLSSSNCRGQSGFYIEDGRGVSSFYSISPYNDYNKFVVDAVLSAQLKVIEWMSGRSGILERVEVEFDRVSYADAYAEYFKCPILFGQSRNALVIKPKALKFPLLQHDKNAFLSLKEICDERLTKLTKNRTLSEKVIDAINPLLAGNTPCIEQVSARLGMPTWNLRRELKKHDTSFQILLNDTRKELATCYLKETNLAIGEIAYLLGYASPIAFSKAFKRWTALAPGQYRMQELNDYK